MGVDAVVIGAGHNGLVAANILADHGWGVTVVEAQNEPGGAVRSAELIEPGYVNDVCSAFYPLVAASPVFASLDLADYGLRWGHAPAVLAHPRLDGTCPVISRDLADTAASLDACGRGDGAAWMSLFQRWRDLSGPLLDAFLSPFPPVRAGIALASRIGRRNLLRFARFSLLPARRLGEEHFRSDGARRLLAGAAFHADLGPESPLSGFFGWFMCCLAQDVGFPVAEGGAQSITNALVRRLEERGGRLLTNSPVTSVLIKRQRAAGIELSGGDVIEATRAVLADVDAPTLYLSLVGRQHLDPRVIDDIERFHWDTATVKIDWNLNRPIPWTADGPRRAGTVHLCEGLDGLTQYAADLACNRIPHRPYLVVGQPALADPSRQPTGKATAWAYTHVPRHVDGANDHGAWGDVDAVRQMVEETIEAHAPGFSSSIRGRYAAGPLDFQNENANLSLGAMNAGTAQIHQQIVFRPVPGLARPETPVAGLYLASASAHPGGGVHGAPGANAARAALLHARCARFRVLRPGYGDGRGK